MNILNINSYYFSSSLYKPMEDSLIDNGFNIKTYVPLRKNYRIRDQITFKVPNYVDMSICFKNFHRLFFFYKHYLIKKDILKTYNFNKFNVLHAHSLFSNGYIAYQVYRKFNIPYIVAVRSTDLNIFFKKMLHLRRLGRQILLNADKVIFLSNPYKNFCLEQYIPSNDKKEIMGKSEIIPNGIDNFWFENLNKPKKLNNKLLRLLFVGNCSKRKNIHTLLEACDLLVKQGIKIILTVVGPISNPELLTKLKSLEYVKLVGEVKKDKLLTIYRKSDIFVLPSISETFGLVYAEAMSQGIPIIYTRGQGFDQQFEEGAVGYSVNPNNEYDICQKIIMIMKEYNKISARCLSLVFRFSWRRIGKEYGEIYNNINI